MEASYKRGSNEWSNTRPDIGLHHWGQRRIKEWRDDRQQQLGAFHHPDVRCTWQHRELRTW
jgi:hypothetical protein